MHTVITGDELGELAKTVAKTVGETTTANQLAQQQQVKWR